MTAAMIGAIFNLTSLVATVGAIVLAYDGKEGWGWLIFLALATHTTGKVTTP